MYFTYKHVQITSKENERSRKYKNDAIPENISKYIQIQVCMWLVIKILDLKQ